MAPAPGDEPEHGIRALVSASTIDEEFTSLRGYLQSRVIAASLGPLLDDEDQRRLLVRAIALALTDRPAPKLSRYPS